MNLFEKLKNLEIDLDLDSLTEVAKNGAIIGTEIINSNYKKIQKITSKGRKGDLVTNVDLEVENKIKEYLVFKTPNISILAEETGKTNMNSEMMWCIDPLDGTTNYSHGYPFFGTSIGLIYKGIPILGAISVPYLEELYWGCISKGSYCNNAKITVSKPRNLSESLLITGFAYDRFETINNNYAEFCWLTHKTRGVRRGGAAAVDLAFIAAGKADGFWERGLQIWDIAAGAIIVYEAGGIISNYPEGELDINSGRILACSPTIDVELRNELSRVTPFDLNTYT
tara:strand:+ start:370 stop:1218 length:849 start_codon:yes stop_codon:yes gene_type:complete